MGISWRLRQRRQEVFALGMPPRKGLEVYAIEPFTTESKLAHERGKGLRNGACAIDLGVDNHRPVFFMNKISNDMIRVWIHTNFGHLDASMCRGEPYGTDAKVGLELTA